MITEEPPAPAAWQDVLLGAIASGVDLAQIERQLALSPTERLDRMRKVLMV